MQELVQAIANVHQAKFVVSMENVLQMIVRKIVALVKAAHLKEHLRVIGLEILLNMIRLARIYLALALSVVKEVLQLLNLHATRQRPTAMGVVAEIIHRQLQLAPMARHHNLPSI